jgi:uncharacterized membrane protein
MHGLCLFSIGLHIFAASIWIGGTIFLVFVLVPVNRSPEMKGMARDLIRLTGLKFRRVGWICFGVLLGSGLFNLSYRGVRWVDFGKQEFWECHFGRVLAVKLLIVVLIFLMSFLHDFVIGPRATAVWRENPFSSHASRLRNQAKWIGRVNLILGLMALTLGIILVRGLP